MGYTPYLISNWATGIDVRLQPWLSPDDAQEELFDGFVYRGTLSKREGYNYFATGLQGGAPYRESRIVSLSANVMMVGVINSSNRVFTLAGTVQIARGSVTVVGNTPSQTFTDNGLGLFLAVGINVSAITNASPPEVTTAVNHGFTTGDEVVISGVVGMEDINSVYPYTITVTGLDTFTLDGIDSTNFGVYVSGGSVRKVIGSVNYTSGAISITLPVAPTGGTVVVSYSSMPGLPVMMVAQYVTATNAKQLIVADTRYVNRYNSTTNTLEDITPSGFTFSGLTFEFFTWENYASATFVPRLIFANNHITDVIKQYDGSVVTDYTYLMNSSAASPILVTSLNASFIVEMKDRLILLRTTEDGTVYGQRIRVSGTGINCDVYSSSLSATMGGPLATGAGFIDIPDGTWIQGAAFNRDDLLIFTEAATWVMKYTGNDVKPFVLGRIDESRGCDATFSVITYLNRTSACSRRGLIISDGYRVERQDEGIPDFSFNEINGNVFNLCFAGSVDADRDHYLIYPPAGEATSSRILTTNYDEDNYSIYRLPLSCMGTYQVGFDTTWDALIGPDPSNPVYPTWDSFAGNYGDWNSFAYNAGAPFSIGGGQNGEIWTLSVREQEDNEVRIYNIQIINTNTLQITTDYNNYSTNPGEPLMGKDQIYLSGIEGMLEANNKQYALIDRIDPNNFTVDTGDVDATTFSAYISGGRAVRVIPMSCLFKSFNPYVEIDKKVRCGWVYFYVDSTATDVTRNIAISNATQTNPCVVTTGTAHGLQTGNIVSIFGVVGMTQLNGQQLLVTMIDDLNISLDGVNASGTGMPPYDAYISGGYLSTPVPAKLIIQIFTNDRDPNDPDQLNNLNPQTYQATASNLLLEDGEKKWYKLYVNQVGKFIQMRVINQQAGTTINIQALMFGFQPVGRLI